MSSFPDKRQRRLQAQSLVARARNRARFDEGVGILQVAERCDQPEARELIRARYGVHGQQGEALRLVTLTDEMAHEHADPDAEWD